MEGAQGVGAVGSGAWLCAPEQGLLAGWELGRQGHEVTAPHAPAGALVLLSLDYLTSLFYYIPKSALAAVIIMAVVPLFDTKIVGTLWRVKSMYLLSVGTKVIDDPPSAIGCCPGWPSWGRDGGFGVTSRVRVIASLSPLVIAAQGSPEPAIPLP